MSLILHPPLRCSAFQTYGRCPGLRAPALIRMCLRGASSQLLVANRVVSLGARATVETLYTARFLYRTLSIPHMLIGPCQHPDSFECSAIRKRKENALTEDKSGKKRVSLTLGQKRDVICCLAENIAVPDFAAEFGISLIGKFMIYGNIRGNGSGHPLAMRKTVLRRDERNRGSPQIH